MMSFSFIWLTYMLAIIAGFLLFIYLFMTRHSNYWKLKGIQYFPLEFPFGAFKDVIFFRISICDLITELYTKTDGSFSGFFSFSSPCLLVKDPEAVKAILIRDFNHFTDRGTATNLINDKVGNFNLPMLKYDQWKSLRYKLNPLFSKSKMKALFLSLKESGEELTKHLQSRVNSVVQAKLFSVKFMVDITVGCVFGIKSNSLMDELDRYYLAARKIISFSYDRAFQMSAYFFWPERLVQFLRLKFVHPDAEKFFRKVFIDNMKYRLDNNYERNDFFQYLLDLKKKDNSFDDDKLLAQSVIFLLAGFEAASSLISLTLHHLAYRPDLQTKLRDEIHTVLAKHGHDISYEALNEMQYLHMVIFETLRLHAPVGFLTRECTKPYIFEGTNFTVEPGTKIFISIHGLHRDPKYFPNPDVFDPERFSKENKLIIPSGVYLPFGLGPRLCIGERFGLLASKMAVVTALKDFEFFHVKESPLTVKMDIRSFFTTSLNWLPLKFRRISTPND